jgi:hypothetical protein
MAAPPARRTPALVAALLVALPAVILAVMTAATSGATAAPAGAPSPAKAASQVYLVQGVPGGPADVTVDGTTVVTGLGPAEVHGPVELAPGRHVVAFAGDGWEVEAPVTVRRPSEDVVVHLPADASADPVVTVFANELGPVPAGQGRLTVAHTAVVPPADIRAAGEVLFANVANGEFVTTEVPADSYEVDVVPTGGDDPLLGPLDLEVAAGALTRVFAIGQPEDGAMTAVVQVIPLPKAPADPPSGVGAGLPGPDGAEGRGSSLAAGSLGVLLLLAALLVALRGRARVRG